MSFEVYRACVVGTFILTVPLCFADLQKTKIFTYIIMASRSNPSAKGMCSRALFETGGFSSNLETSRGCVESPTLHVGPWPTVYHIDCRRLLEE